MDMADVMRRRRHQLGLSQGDLAKAAGVGVRQIARYEAGEQQPVLSVAAALADALGISLSQLAGKVARGVDLNGDWWAAWQTYRANRERVLCQAVRFTVADDELFSLVATTLGAAPEEGGYLWRGELRLWDNDTLMGWYAALDAAVRARGTLYLTVHPHGIRLVGRWVGLSMDGIVTGWAAMARDHDEAVRQIAALKASGGGNGLT